MLIDKKEYWILDILFESGCVLSLIDPDEIGWHFFPGHGLDRGQLVEVLDRLFQGGDLQAERGYLCQEPDIFLPTRIEIEVLLLTGIPKVTIFLTPQGGQRWEVASAPDWDRYISNGWGEDWWSVESADRRLIERHLASPAVQSRMLPGSEVWDVLAPWDATYWKTLPVGHRVRFRLNETDEESPWARPDADWYSNVGMNG